MKQIVKVHIASSRPKQIGNRCRQWARINLPPGFEMTEIPDDCALFISVLCDTLITKQFIDSRKCYNFHPGILPNYRGSGIYSWVLINKETETGVTLHEIDYNIDSGPIIATSRTQITEHDTADSIFVRCMDLLYSMFVAYFSRLLSGDYQVYPNEGGRLYLRRHLEDAKDISHLVRAFTFKGKESAYWRDSSGVNRYVEWK